MHLAFAVFLSSLEFLRLLKVYNFLHACHTSYNFFFHYEIVIFSNECVGILNLKVSFTVQDVKKNLLRHAFDLRYHFSEIHRIARQTIQTLLESHYG